MVRDISETMLQSFEAIKQAVSPGIPKILKDVSTGGLAGKAAMETAHSTVCTTAPTKPVESSDADSANNILAEK